MESADQLARARSEGYETYTGLFMGPAAQKLVERSGLAAGDIVLDLACGTGLVARETWPLVEPGGRVVAVDINPAMLDVARSLLNPAVECITSPAEAIPIDDDTFNHVFCQQGFQFFADQARSANEAYRVLKPGGQLHATVWDTPGNNPYIENQVELLRQLDQTSSPATTAPMSPEAMLQSVAEGAGFDAIRISRIEHDVLFTDVRAFFLGQSLTTPWSEAVTALSAAERDELVTNFADRLAPWSHPDGSHTIPFCTHYLVAYRGEA